MKISVAMATCNGEPFVAAQLDSLVAQSRRPDELVITDDQSSDGTIALIRSFARSAPFPVQIEINSCRLGITDNFSKALSLCTGELVLLCDQDDVWFPEKIATLEALALECPDSACFVNDALLTNEQLEPSGVSKQGQIRASGLPGEAMVMGCCTSFRHDLLEILLPIPHDPQGHDGWLVHFSDLLGQTVRTDVPLQYYRRHDNNASNIFVNRLQPPTLLDRARMMLNSLPRRIFSRDGLNNELTFFALASERMTGRTAAMSRLIGQESAERVRISTATRARLLARRQVIRAQPRLRRIAMVWALLQSGGYRTSGSSAGALKDLLIRARADSAPQ